MRITVSEFGKSKFKNLVEDSNVFLPSVLISCAFLLSGCITLGNEQISSEVAQETSSLTRAQTALVNLSSQLTTTPWPQPARLSVTGLMLGTTGQQAPKTSFDSVNAYIEVLTHRATVPTSSALDNEFQYTLQSAAKPLPELIFEDADKQLQTASIINNLARDAATSSRLSPTDITAVETAILALRDNRTVFVDTLKTLSQEGQSVDKSDIRALRTAFINAGRTLGVTADLMADKLAGEPVNFISDTPIALQLSE